MVTSPCPSSSSSCECAGKSCDYLQFFQEHLCTCTYIKEEAQHGSAVGMIECFANCCIFLVAMHNMHLHRIAYIVDDMLRATIVLVAPVEVQTLHLKLTGQLGATYIGQELILFLSRISLGYTDGDWRENGRLINAIKQWSSSISKPTYPYAHC